MNQVFEAVGAIVIVLFLLMVYLLLSSGRLKLFVNALDDCNSKEGECLSSCGNQEPIPAGDPGCKKQFPNADAICCKRDMTNVQAGVGQRGEGANKNIIKLIINKNSIPYGQEVLLDQDTLYNFSITIDETGRQKIKDYGRVCSVYIKEFDLTSVPKILQRTKSPVDIINPNSYHPPVFAVDNNYNDQDNSLVVACSDINKLIPEYFKPTELDAGKRYEFDVIVYDKYVEGNFSSNPKGKDDKSMPGSGILTQENIDERPNLPYDNSHWVANFFITLKVKPIIEINDIGTVWAAQDDITVNALSPWTLEKVAVAVVSAKEIESMNGNGASTSENLYNTCKSPAIASRYVTSLYKISRINTGSNGIGILGIGKENFQTASYDAAQAQPIPITNKRSAIIHLDAASFLYGYYGAAAISGLTGGSALSLIGADSADTLFRETQNGTDNYLCVKASVSKSAKEQSKIITAFSIQPLRIDIAPPTISNDDAFISVNYPKPFKSLTSGLTNQLTGQNQYSNYYFQEYPYIEITNKCYDRSGCKNFDYYFAPTRIPVNIVADNTKDAVVSLLIGEGLNLLYNQIVNSNPLKTVCPLADSGKYRRNTNNQIRFYDVQGVFCIKVSDGAGNYWLTWKAVYNPYSVLEKAANSIVSSPTDTGTIVPRIGQ